MVRTCIRGWSDSGLDLLDIAGRCGSETGDLGEQVRHGLTFIGKEAHIAFRLSPGQNQAQSGEGALCLALRLQHQGYQHLQLDKPAIEALVGDSLMEMIEQKSC